jgi:lipoprotein NlpI
LVSAGARHLISAEAKPEELLEQANDAFKKGNSAEALALAAKAIEADPKNAKPYLWRGQFYEATRQHEKAISDFDHAVQLEPRTAIIYQHRGSERFKLGQFKESIADFDKFIELVPQQAPHHWQRGISYYYAGRYEDGRRQFELHQTVNPNDVENAVWHFLCVARVGGLDKARQTLIKIKSDGRVPMMQVYALFAGEAKPEDVLAAANAGNPSGAERTRRLFYAHLYLGLYQEAAGEQKLARDHLIKAAEEYVVDDYMGDVARVHVALLRAKPPKVD